MALALLASTSELQPPDSQPEFKAVKFPVRPADLQPVLVATFEEAWERLEKLSRRSDPIHSAQLPYIQELKYSIAAVSNLVRASEAVSSGAVSSGAESSDSVSNPGLVDEQAIRARQKAFAVKQTDEVLKHANAQILAAPPDSEGKYSMMEIVHSLMLVKGRAEHSPATECRGLFLRALGKLMTELPL